MLVLDGSAGGGQMLRTALGLSVVTQKSFALTNVRGGREEPGLKTQHLEALKAIALLCNAEVTGAQLGSREVAFTPNKITETKLDVEIGTAGSVGLVFQTLQLVPYVLKKRLFIRVKGGATYGKWAPPADYLKRVFIPLMHRFGYNADVLVDRHGFYPKGGAAVTFYLDPWKPSPITLTERGEPRGVYVYSVASKDLQKQEVAERQAKTAKHELNAEGLKVAEDFWYTETLNPGSGVVCYAEYERTVLGGDAIGERGVRAEDVGKQAAQKLLAAMKSDGVLDRQTSDMILPFLALAGGEARVQEMTNHVRTNISVIEAFLPMRFKIEGTLVKTSGF